MVKPINSKTQQAAQPTQVKKTEPEKTKIGGVLFRKDHVEKAETYTVNGQKMNSVFVKPGVRIDYPDQTDPNKNPSVESLGIREEWYNPDNSIISIEDLEGAKIFGNKNKSDYIILEGKSSNNEIFVNQKESWYIDKSQRFDMVDLHCSTENNTVHMDEKDKTDISYHQSGVYYGDEMIKSPIGSLHVEGKGTSEQEAQLQDTLGKDGYTLHKHVQNRENNQ